MTYAKSGLFWSQCFLPSLVIGKAQAGAGKSSLASCVTKNFAENLGKIGFPAKIELLQKAAILQYFQKYSKDSARCTRGLRL